MAAGPDDKKEFTQSQDHSCSPYVGVPLLASPACAVERCKPVAVGVTGTEPVVHKNTEHISTT
jgi:hypothetical protein